MKRLRLFVGVVYFTGDCGLKLNRMLVLSSDWLLSCDRNTFDGTVSHFMTGSGKKMMAYRKADGTLVRIVPEPEE